MRNGLLKWSNSALAPASLYWEPSAAQVQPQPGHPPVPSRAHGPARSLRWWGHQPGPAGASVAAEKNVRQEDNRRKLEHTFLKDRCSDGRRDFSQNVSLEKFSTISLICLRYGHFDIIRTKIPESLRSSDRNPWICVEIILQHLLSSLKILKNWNSANFAKKMVGRRENSQKSWIVQRKICRVWKCWKMLPSKKLVAKLGVDTAEKEPPEEFKKCIL